MSETDSGFVSDTKLEEILEQYGDREFTLLEPGGNHGDKLIYNGLERKLGELGIQYDSVNYLDYLRNNFSAKVRKGVNLVSDQLGFPQVDELSLDNPEVIYIHGGGNFSDLWGSSMAIFRNVTQNYPDTPVIIGPQTYWFSGTDFSELVEDTNQNIELFCREEYSYALLNNFSIPRNVSIHRSHDTALYLDQEYLRSQIDESVLEEVSSGQELLSFRSDREGIVPKTAIAELEEESRDPLKIDISDKSMTSFDEFITIAAQADSIHTDRLHVSILGTLLGKPVQMYENIYYKNRGVYKFTLSDVEKTNFNEAI